MAMFRRISQIRDRQYWRPKRSKCNWLNETPKEDKANVSSTFSYVHFVYAFVYSFVWFIHHSFLH